MAAVGTPREDLAAALWAISAAGDDIIVSGGVAAMLYHELDWAAAVRHRPLLTYDLDLTIRAKASRRVDRSLTEALGEAGFVEVMARGTEPPIGRFQPQRFGAQVLAPVHIEFLTPQIGRLETPVVTTSHGVTAQRLPFLQLAFDEPMSVSHTQVPWFREGTTVWLPHPATYLLVKLLVMPRRDADRRAKDAAYVYDVAALTRERWPDLAAVWGRLQAKPTYAKWTREALATLRQTFDPVGGEGPVWVRRMLADSLEPSAAPTERAVATIIERLAAALEGR